MAAPSRLPIDPSTLLPSIQSFGQLSNFLRSAVADEECQQMSESMGLLASHIEAVLASLQLEPARAVVAPALMDLLTALRGHRAMVVELSTAWRGLYEYAQYLSALNNLRVLIGQWLLQDKGKRFTAVSLADFELIAWRTLGEGMLLIDMYEQWRGQEASQMPAGARVHRVQGEQRLARAKTWWDKLRG